MKNAVFSLVLLSGFFVLFACGSPPPPAPAAPPPPPPPPPTAAPPPPPSRASDLVLEGAETYIVSRRDTLSNISRRKYNNNGFYYPLIMMASKDIVSDEDIIEIGTVLIIPNIAANLADERARKSMKKFFLEQAVITERDHKRPRDAAGLRDLVKDW